MIDVLLELLWIIDVLMLVYLLGIDLTLGALAVLGWRAIDDYIRRRALRDYEAVAHSPLSPPISIIAPAHDEEISIVGSVRGLLESRYPKFEVLVVNDGSTDQTLAQLSKAFDLVEVERVPNARLSTRPVRSVYTCPWDSRLTVLDKEKGGKADALNAGIAFAMYPLFCAIDADTMLDRGALARLAWEFLAHPDTVAAGGIVRVINGSTVHDGRIVEIKTPPNLLVNIQILEYVRAFFLGRVAWARLGMLLIISGAFGVFRRDLVIELGGYETGTVGEDAELVLRLHRHRQEHRLRYRIAFFPDSICWTEAPSSLRVLVRQRDRWQRGLIEMLARHRAMIARPRYGRIGILALPYYLIFEMLGPVIEVIGYAAFVASIALGIAPLGYTLSFLALAITFALIISFSTLLVEERAFQRYAGWRCLGRLVLAAFAENVGYRQLVAFVRARAWWKLLQKADWGNMERSGFVPPRLAHHDHIHSAPLASPLGTPQGWPVPIGSPLTIPKHWR